MDTFVYGPGDQEEMTRLYLQKLDEFLIQYELMRIETTYGDTQVIITGKKENPALVLLYGLVSGASLAGDTTFNLVNDFRIYTVDVSVHPNLSDEGCLSMNDDSYGKWMYEILSRLGVRNVFLTGISLGGFAALKALAFDDTKIAKAFLINPLGLTNGGVLENLPPVPFISKEEVEKIKTPLYIFAAENDLLFQGRIFPSLNKTVLLEGSKQVLSEHDNKKIVKIIRNNIGV
jgi:pimeloyl-ACP methyl ester carboxylesterase